MRLFYLFVLFRLVTPAEAAVYWVCGPQAKDSAAPRLILLPQADPKLATFYLESDWVRGKERIPAGEYPGKLEPSASGFSVFAKMDVGRYFANPYPKPGGSWLTLALNTKSTLFAVETYVLWYSDQSEVTGDMIGWYTCRRRIY